METPPKDILQEIFNEPALYPGYWRDRIKKHLSEPPFMQQQVGHFNKTFGCHQEETPTIPSRDVCTLRSRLIIEEAFEFKEAVKSRDLVEAADALGDLLYVVFGAADALGINLGPVFNEIHQSNMSKAQPDGSVKYREDGKVLKPEGWKPPDIRPILEAQMKEKMK